MKLQEVLDWLEQQKQAGSVLDYEITHDVGHKVVIHVEWAKGDDEYEGQNYVLKIVNRGTPTETVYWADRKLELMTATEDTSALDTILQGVYNRLTASGLKVLISYNIEKEKKIITGAGYFTVDNNTVTMKNFLVIYDDVDGTYELYEIV